MKIFTLLVTCLILSLLQVHKFTVNKSNLFSNRVSNQNFNYKYNYLHFSNNGRRLQIYNDHTDSSLVLILDSVYTSSKAVYKTLDGNFLGIVLIDSSIYVTKIVNTMININFENIYFIGIQEKFFL
ncbi:MAG: hypothetical protein KFW21_05270 [Spirochaetota bacterium]|nr:hypothetical protein [Spirochaetota bacterium]